MATTHFYVVSFALSALCPPEICTYTKAGTAARALPAPKDASGSPKGKEDYGIYAAACA